MEERLLRQSKLNTERFVKVDGPEVELLVEDLMNVSGTGPPVVVAEAGLVEVEIEG